MAYDPSTAGTFAQFIARVAANIALLWSTNRSATIDAGAVEGTQRVDSNAAAEIHKIYIDFDGTGPVEVEVGTRIHGDLKCVATNPAELQNFALEQAAADPTPGAGNIGRVVQLTGTGEVRFVVNATTMGTLGGVADGGLGGQPFIPIGACDLDATNPPTAVTVSTTPMIRGKLFDATNEKCSFGFLVPAGFTGAADGKLRVWAYLSAAETNLDTIDATLDIRTVQPNNAEVPTGTSTQAVVAYVVTTAKGVAQYTLYVFDFVLDFNDANNPFAAGDWVECEFALSSVASVAGIIVRGFQPLFPIRGNFSEA